MPNAVYEWCRVAFQHEGRCDICERWTRSGVRRSGYVRFRHLCEDCARNRFGGEIVAGLSSPVPPILSAAQVKMLQAACGEIEFRTWTGLGSWEEQRDLIRMEFVISPSAFTSVRITTAGKAALARTTEAK